MCMIVFHLFVLMYFQFITMDHNAMQYGYAVSLGAHLFVKAPRPRDSEGISSVFRVKLPPVTTN